MLLLGDTFIFYLPNCNIYNSLLAFGELKKLKLVLPEVHNPQREVRQHRNALVKLLIWHHQKCSGLRLAHLEQTVVTSLAVRAQCTPGVHGPAVRVFDVLQHERVRINSIDLKHSARRVGRRIAVQPVVVGRRMRDSQKSSPLE